MEKTFNAFQSNLMQSSNLNLNQHEPYDIEANNYQKHIQPQLSCNETINDQVNNYPYNYEYHDSVNVDNNKHQRPYEIWKECHYLNQLINCEKESKDSINDNQPIDEKYISNHNELVYEHKRPANGSFNQSRSSSRLLNKSNDDTTMKQSIKKVYVMNKNQKTNKVYLKHIALIDNENVNNNSVHKSQRIDKNNTCLYLNTSNNNNDPLRESYQYLKSRSSCDHMRLSNQRKKHCNNNSINRSNKTNNDSATYSSNKILRNANIKGQIIINQSDDIAKLTQIKNEIEKMIQIKKTKYDNGNNSHNNSNSYSNTSMLMQTSTTNYKKCSMTSTKDNINPSKIYSSRSMSSKSKPMLNQNKKEKKRSVFDVGYIVDGDSELEIKRNHSQIINNECTFVSVDKMKRFSKSSTQNNKDRLLDIESDFTKGNNDKLLPTACLPGKYERNLTENKNDYNNNLDKILSKELNKVIQSKGEDIDAIQTHSNLMSYHTAERSNEIGDHLKNNNSNNDNDEMHNNQQIEKGLLRGRVNNRKSNNHKEEEENNNHYTLNPELQDSIHEEQLHNNNNNKTKINCLIEQHNKNDNDNRQISNAHQITIKGIKKLDKQKPNQNVFNIKIDDFLNQQPKIELINSIFHKTQTKKPSAASLINNHTEYSDKKDKQFLQSLLQLQTELINEQPVNIHNNRNNSYFHNYPPIEYTKSNEYLLLPLKGTITDKYYEKVIKKSNNKIIADKASEDLNDPFYSDNPNKRKERFYSPQKAFLSFPGFSSIDKSKTKSSVLSHLSTLSPTKDSLDIFNLETKKSTNSQHSLKL